MNILILNGSPKKKLSASGFFAGILKLMLAGYKITEYPVRNSETNNILECMKTADAVLISTPLYVDGIPSHILGFLNKGEQFCKNNACHFNLYVISNSGFVEGHHNEIHLKQYQCWCERSGIVYGGGLGIGGAVMLHVVFYAILLLDIGEFIVKNTVNIFFGQVFLLNESLFSLGRGIATWLFFNITMLLCEYILARNIKKSKSFKNIFTRVMVPSFVFLICADIFMVIKALFNGKLIFSLFKKEKSNNNITEDINYVYSTEPGGVANEGSTLDFQ
jgi:multimeric flavodoxin WrbA